MLISEDSMILPPSMAVASWELGAIAAKRCSEPERQ